MTSTFMSRAPFPPGSEACRLAVRAAEKEGRQSIRGSFVRGQRGGAISTRSPRPVIASASWNEREHLREADLPRARRETANQDLRALGVNKKHDTGSNLVDVRREEMSRGRRPIDLETRSQRQELLHDLRKSWKFEPRTTSWRLCAP